MTQSSTAILLTRPAAQAERFAKMLRHLFGGDLQIVISPILEIQIHRVQLDVSLDTKLVFTSEYGVRAFAHSTPAAGRKAFCVGDRTAEVAKKYGFEAKSAGGDARDLIKVIKAQNAPGPYLFACGASIRVDVAEELVNLGYDAKKATVYSQHPLSLNADAGHLINSDSRIILPLFSPRSARFVYEATKRATAHLYPIALSNAVARSWPSPYPPGIASKPDATGMITQIATILTDTSP